MSEYRRVTRCVVYCAVVLMLLIGGYAYSISAMAQESTPSTNPSADFSHTFEFYPSTTGFGTYFDIRLEPGKTTELDTVLVNTGQKSVDVRTYATNASTKDGGGFLPGAYGEPQTETAKWLDFPETVYSVNMGESKHIPLKITVPKDAKPGQYIAAVAAEDAVPTTISDKANFTQTVRFVIPIFIQVPGETTTAFSIESISLSQDAEIVLVAIGIENTGDVRVRPEGNIRVSDAEGHTVATVPVKMGSVYAHDRTTLNIGLTGLLTNGTYTVDVQLRDPESGKESTKKASNIAVAASETVTAPIPQQVVITSATATPKPAADNVQFAEVAATIVNNGEAITNAQLSLVASKDGAEVERFPISQSLSLPIGETPVTTRYIPAEGWSSGNWTFELLVETVDPSGAAVVMARLPVDGTITIP